MPRFQDEPESRSRDSSQGLLIASGIFKQLVPGSPANPYLGTLEAALKLDRTIFQCLGKKFELRGQNIFASSMRGRTATRLVEFIGQQQRGEQQILRILRREIAVHALQFGIDHAPQMPQPGFLPRAAGDQIGLARNVELYLAHRSRLSISASRSRSVPATSDRKACVATSTAAEDGALAAPFTDRSIRASAISIRPKAFLIRSPSI